MVEVAVGDDVADFASPAPLVFEAAADAAAAASLPPAAAAADDDREDPMREGKKESDKLARASIELLKVALQEPLHKTKRAKVVLTFFFFAVEVNLAKSRAALEQRDGSFYRAPALLAARAPFQRARRRERRQRARIEQRSRAPSDR